VAVQRSAHATAARPSKSYRRLLPLQGPAKAMSWTELRCPAITHLNCADY